MSAQDESPKTNPDSSAEESAPGTDSDRRVATSATELDLNSGLDRGAGQAEASRRDPGPLDPPLEPREPVPSDPEVSEPPATVRPPARSQVSSHLTLRKATLTSEEDSGRTPAPAVDAYVGYIIDGRYHIKKQLAEGGMGVVYQARHRLIDKLVAVKILRPELVHDREITQRFLTEAQAASAIGSEHIVDITDFGELPDRATYIVMEYLEGQSLTERIRQGEPLEISEVLVISRQIAEGLARAHAAGIIHRDLKPDNVLLINRGKQRDFVKILDFGIAKVASSQNQITRAGKIFGTPHYMSPEQAKGEELDRRTDIYSLGVMLYEMIAQQLPFEAENPLGVLTQHMYVEAKPLHEVCDRDVPVALEAIIAKCISKKPHERYSSMLELEEDLARVAEGLEPMALEELANRGRVPQSLRSLHAAPILSVPGIAAGAACAMLLAAASYFSRASTPALEAKAAVAESSSPEASATGVGTASTAAQAAGAPEGRVVALVLSPVDARVYRGKHDLGPMPLSIRLRPGQRMSLEVRRPGYVTQTVTIDGAVSRKVVELVAIPGAPRGSIPTSMPDPAAARTISFASDAGAVVIPAAREAWEPEADAGAPRPRASFGASAATSDPEPEMPEPALDPEGEAPEDPKPPGPPPQTNPEPAGS